MFGTVARYASRNDFTTFRRKQSEILYILIIDNKAAIGTEPTNLPSVIGHLASALVIHRFSPLLPSVPLPFPDRRQRPYSLDPPPERSSYGLPSP